jgi:uncharacterized repeat protein (TIGR01451 family)
MCYPQIMPFAGCLLQITLYPDVTISKPPAVSIPIASNGNYTVTVENDGAVVAPNTVVTEELPPGLQYISGPSSCTVTGQTVTCTIGDMGPGEISNIPLTVKPTIPGPLVTSGTVAATDEQNTNNNGPANTTITVVRTCAVYNGDGSSFPCGADAVPNTNNSQSTSPNTTICCVSSYCSSNLALCGWCYATTYCSACDPGCHCMLVV